MPASGILVIQVPGWNRRWHYYRRSIISRVRKLRVYGKPGYGKRTPTLAMGGVVGRSNPLRPLGSIFQSCVGRRLLRRISTNTSFAASIRWKIRATLDRIHCLG